MHLKFKKKPNDGHGFDIEFHFKGTQEEFRKYDWRELR